MGAGVQRGGGRTGRRGRTRGRARPIAEINVTPFVDVMLVLLVIFMVAAPLLTVGVPLELPESRAEALPQEDDEPLTVTLDGEGQIFIQDTAVPRAELIPLLTAIQRARGSDRIYLRADRSIDYGRVMGVMGALNGAGFRNIGLVTDPAEN